MTAEALSYRSTRGQAAPVGLDAALDAGLAPDGGLYVPERMPTLPAACWQAPGSLPEVATRTLAPFFAGSRLAAELPAICRAALDLPIRLQTLRSGRYEVLELTHGPTAAFKDFGARFLAESLARLDRAGAIPRTILVATSGDTGAAVAAAFAERSGFRVVILYPAGGVSARQAHQLGAYAPWAQAFAVAGRFDDCQALVKRALADRALTERWRLGSANSISLGRLLPQVAYYAWAALAYRARHHAPAPIAVPTGNLGNALAAVWARALGAPIARIHLACNANDVLPQYFAGAPYRPRASRNTLANAMDVGAPSNFERLVALLGEPRAVEHRLSSASTGDAEIETTIRRVLAEEDYLICPHTACAFAQVPALAGGDPRQPWLIVATADPAKFETIVEPVLGRKVPVPPALAAVLARPSHAAPLAADYEALIAALACDRDAG